MQKKISKSFWFFTSLDLNWLRKIVSIKRRVLLIGSECVNKHS